MIRRWTAPIILSLIFCAAAPVKAYALFSLSVSPQHGAQDIRFDLQNGRENEEVTVTMSSDIGSAYQISEQMMDPLTNQFGDTLPQGTLTMFSPSNPLGTLRVQNETPVRMGQYPIYQSNGAGQSDEFVLVFHVNLPENQKGGIYTSRITFVAEPQNAGAASPQVRTLTVRIDVSEHFRVTVESEKGGKALAFPEINERNASVSEALKVLFEGNPGGRFRVLANITQSPVTADGEVLDGALKLSKAGSDCGSAAVSSPTALSNSPLLVFTSDPSGSCSQLALEFLVAPESGQRYGEYRTNLELRLQGEGAASAADTTVVVPIRIVIESMFNLEIKTTEISGIHFGSFKSDTGKVAREVQIVVKTNRGEPYQISQVLSKRPTHADGTVLEENSFTWYGSDADSGHLAVTAETPVRTGESSVFTSDNEGDPAAFTVHYLLSPPVDAKAGSYDTELYYSLTSI